jgi:peptidoglycan/xylan/chitin deacetylase (PgdA/CDA1 family)
MHDYIGTHSRTAQALEQILPVLIARGYEFVTVSELLDDA